MTTEIVVANRGAIALAADSAASVRTRDGFKVFSANKIFPLSKIAPVGIMVYGYAAFCGVPWETVIKEFRNRRLKDCLCPSIKDYKGMFVSFLESFVEKNALLLVEGKNAHISIFLEGIISELVGGRDVNTFSPPEFFEKIKDFPGDHQEFFDDSTIFSFRNVEEVKEEMRGVLCKLFDSAGEEARNRLLGEKGSDEERGIFEELLSLSLRICKQKNSLSIGAFSGLVFAGFGENQIFPEYLELRVNGVLGGELWSEELNSCCIGKDSDVSICPFAQRDVINTFMKGISEEHEEFVVNALLKSLYDGMGSGEASQNSLDQTRKALSDAIGVFSKENFVYPVVEAVSFLHFDELATMAETLVNLTSFKRRVSSDAETVGGPVDVAVITKGDGFVWIKRKHYFPKDINYRFFQNYLQEIRYKGIEEEE